MLALLTGLLMVTAQVSTTTPQKIIKLVEPIVAQRVEAQEAEPTEKEIIINQIKEVFGKDSEIALKVATCESSLRQTQDGKPLVSKTHDTGVFQISWVHEKKLKELKLDPEKLEDNIKYAKYLFDRNQLKDWSQSKKCWSK